jgi:hypothetical protein
MAQIPFVGPSYNLRKRPQSVQRSINLVPVPQEPGNERTRWVFKDVPGLSSVFTGAGLALLRITEDGQQRITEDGEDRRIEG